MTTPLTPCPFCGAPWTVTKFTYDDKSNYQPSCTGCPALLNAEFGTEEEAVAAANKRDVGMAKILGLIEMGITSGDLPEHFLRVAKEEIAALDPERIARLKKAIIEGDLKTLGSEGGREP